MGLLSSFLNGFIKVFGMLVGPGYLYDADSADSTDSADLAGSTDL